MALSSAVAARLGESALGTVLGHVSGLIAAATLDVVHLVRLRAVHCFVIRSSAVAARKLVDPRLRTVASTMPSATAVDASNLHAVNHDALRLAVLRDVPHLCIQGDKHQKDPWKRAACLTSAIITFGDLAVIRESGISEALKILLRACGPTVLQASSLRFGLEVERNHVLAIKFALEIDQGAGVPNFLLLKLRVRLSFHSDNMIGALTSAIR